MLRVSVPQTPTLRLVIFTGTEFDYNLVKLKLHERAAAHCGVQFIIEDLCKASPKRDEMLYERGEGHTT